MNTPAVIRTALAAALAMAITAGTAAAYSPPVLNFTVGQSFGVDGTPNGGGMSVMFAPMWRVGDRAQFGIAGFADDIGTSRASLFDRTSDLDLGTVTEQHRLTYGLAWRADQDLVQRRRWSAGLTFLAGWWRIADDIRGTPLAATSAIGYGIGATALRTVTPRHEFGLALRYQELTSDRKAKFRRVDHYATAALEWRWTPDGR